MNKLIPNLECSKVTLWDNSKIVIENYHHLIDLKEELVKVDNYIIEGKKLKIVELNQFIIKIYGEIKELKIE